MVNRVNLHCAIAGAGPLIVLLHGFPEFWYSWRHQIPVLAEHFTVVAPDMRGYNDSDKPARIKDYTLPLLVEDIVQLIHSFGQERAVIVGHDWGAVIAWETAQTRPDAVSKLVILNGPHPRLFLQHLLTNPRQRRRSWYTFFFQLPWLPEAFFRANSFHNIKSVFRNTSTHKHCFPDNVIEQYKQALAKPKALTSAINYYRAAARRGPLKLALSEPVVKMPVQVIWGEQDVTLGKELNNDLERYAPNLQLQFIPDASHWVHQERPDLVNKSILNFVLQ